jgi:multidrug efflux pump subunit AcrB
LQLIVAGGELAAINDTANELANEMRLLPMISNPISTAELDRPELRIVPRAQLAADLGISTEALSETIRVATLGDVDANLAKFDAGDRLIPIRVELEEQARADIGLLKALRVATSRGAFSPVRNEPWAHCDQPLRPRPPRHHRSRFARAARPRRSN